MSPWSPSLPEQRSDESRVADPRAGPPAVAGRGADAGHQQGDAGDAVVSAEQSRLPARRRQYPDRLSPDLAVDRTADLRYRRNGDALGGSLRLQPGPAQRKHRVDAV